MACGSPGNGLGRQFALVAYIPEPLGAFLDAVRGELVPGCRLRSHLTILPPRNLDATPEALLEELQSNLRSSHAFTARLNGVEVFTSTKVVYLAIGGGLANVMELHARSGQGGLASGEAFPFHPHVTLAQVPFEGDEGLPVGRAAELWAGWDGAKSFPVDTLTLVANAGVDCWEDLCELRLAPPILAETA
jgi:2'-5' RNA ligase